jgi:hypothetical protein
MEPTPGLWANETFPLSKQVQAVAVDDLLKIVKSPR